MNQPLLRIHNLTVSYPSGVAVQGVNLEVLQGESLGIMGESGSGKTTLVQSILGLLKNACVKGEAFFKEKDLLHHAPLLLGRKIGMVFQDPMTALNPTMKIGAQLEEGLIYHSILPKPEARKRALELLELVGIREGQEKLQRYPFELSGGQRQRVSLAMALSCYPDLLIADEMTTALDTVVQNQVLDLILSLKKQLSMSLLFISHDLGVIAKVCERVAVMYQGKVIEIGETATLMHSPKHPYTKKLLSCRPKYDQSKREPLNLLAPFLEPIK